MAWIKSLKPKGAVRNIKQIMVSHQSKDSKYPPHPAAACQIAKLNLVSGEAYPVPYGSLLNQNKEEGSLPIKEGEASELLEADHEDALIEDSKPLVLCTWEIGREEPSGGGLRSSLCHATKSVHDTQVDMLEKNPGLEEKIKLFQDKRKVMEVEKAKPIREVIDNVTLKSILTISQIFAQTWTIELSLI